jgi:hypothetical protein
MARYAASEGSASPQDILILKAIGFPHNLQDAWPTVIALLHEFNSTFSGFLE